MTNLIDIQSQIEKLQRQADEIKSKEFDKTIKEMVSKMRAFGITAKDLQAATRTAKVKIIKTGHVGGKNKKTPASTVAAKYRGPNGETWSGRGLTPRWLAALLVDGKKKEDFAI